jgi:hypothetical protein
MARTCISRTRPGDPTSRLTSFYKTSGGALMQIKSILRLGQVQVLDKGKLWRTRNEGGPATNSGPANFGFA